MTGLSAEVAVNAVPLAPGGGLTFLVNQARVFTEVAPGWRFTYFASPRNARWLADVVPAERLIVPFEEHPGYAKRVWWEQTAFPALLRDGSFDLAYLPANYAIFRSPVPQVVVDHNSLHHAGLKELGVGPLWLRARLMRLWARATVKRATSVVYLSNAFADGMRRIGFRAPDRVVASGVSLDWGAAPARIPASLSCATCLGDGFALAVHNWYPHKRLGWLSASWAREPELRGLHLVVVGAKQNKTRPNGGHAGVVHQLEGPIPREEVAGLYAGAKLFLSASVLEAFPLTPFEAMSFDVPCVLSDIGAHREVAGDAAVYFEPRSVDSLVSAVAAALAEPQVLADKGRARLSRYSWTKNAQEMIEEFSRVLRSCVAGPGLP